MQPRDRGRVSAASRCAAIVLFFLFRESNYNRNGAVQQHGHVRGQRRGCAELIKAAGKGGRTAVTECELIAKRPARIAGVAVRFRAYARRVHSDSDGTRAALFNLRQCVHKAVGAGAVPLTQ